MATPAIAASAYAKLARLPDPAQGLAKAVGKSRRHAELRAILRTWSAP